MRHQTVLSLLAGTLLIGSSILLTACGHDDARVGRTTTTEETTTSAPVVMPVPHPSSTTTTTTTIEKTIE